MKYQGFQTEEGLTEFYSNLAAVFSLMVSIRQIAMSWAGTKLNHLKYIKPTLLKKKIVLALILHLKKVAKIRRLSCGQFLEHVGASASSSDHNQIVIA